tara:strand:- start:2880 stop:3398 length:519 start_codon:yes stop_codon:yes gene_type:complete
MKEHGIDSMKYRKSTHIAGVDVEAIVDDKGQCILTIKDAFYQKNVDVSGNKTDGYFLEFEEDIKPMVVNSTNRKAIANLVQKQTNCTPSESRKINRWVGIQIELYFDPTVKMMGQVTGGIKVKPMPVVKELKPMPADKLKDAITAVKDGKYTIEQIKKTYALTVEQEKQFKL